MKRLFFPLLPTLPTFLLGMITALAAGPAKSTQPDSSLRAMIAAPERARSDSARLETEKLKRRIAARDRREALVSLGNRVKNPSAIDTLRGLSREDKTFLRRRYRILHPLD